MRNFLDAKIMAKTLREALSERAVDLPHSAALEIVARQFGMGNWNILAARIEAEAPDERPLKIPTGWILSGSQSKSLYRRGIDPLMGKAMLIETRVDRNSGISLGSPNFAGINQSILADAYRGKKLRLTVSLRTEDADTGTAWMRVDERPGKNIRFDNMTQRPSNGALTGTQDWTSRSVVLDVPQEAESVHYGVFLQGFGRVWAKNFKIEVVDITTPVTNRELLSSPQNLDFSLSNTE